MQTQLTKNACAYLQKRFPKATVLDQEVSFNNAATGEVVLKLGALIAHDPDCGMKQRALAFPDLGQAHDLRQIAALTVALFPQVEGTLIVGFTNTLAPRAHPITNQQMMFAPRILLYTNRALIPKAQILDAFATANIMLEIVDESELYNTLFISYGGPDENAVSTINQFLKHQGVKTWFFKDDALPGQKLHRLMHKGVNTYDRVLLVCSRTSLSRKGVLNEIERVLEREAKEGGSEILIPIKLDDYVLSDWAPQRRDIADQVRARVITLVTTDPAKVDAMNMQLQKLILALGKGR